MANGTNVAFYTLVQVGPFSNTPIHGRLCDSYVAFFTYLESSDNPQIKAFIKFWDNYNEEVRAEVHRPIPEHDHHYSKSWRVDVVNAEIPGDITTVITGYDITCWPLN